MQLMFSYAALAPMNRYPGKTRRPKVALIIESSRAYGRGLLQGIARYVREHGAWSIFHQERRASDAPPAWLKDLQGDGIIARVEGHKLASAIGRLGVPAVDVRGLLLDLGLPLIETDDEAVVRLAFEHLRERGFRQFAFCGFPGANYSDTRRRYFAQRIAEAGFKCHDYTPPVRLRSIASFDHEQKGLIFEEDVAEWIAQLPKPIGLLACNDIRGQQVLNACRQIGVAAPDEVAVLGVDNDEVVCDLADPPLSSVIPNTERIGYEAAALLDKMMAGHPAPLSPTYIPPLGVATRRSTDVLAIDDRHIAAALRFIREHACEGIGVPDILSAVPLSRSALERRFATLVGRAPKAEILRVQLQRARELLATTDFPLNVISEKAGFKHPEYLSAIFKKKTGITPGRYRAGAAPR
jgi:LacI family transcriptional regulator